jgi:hypothetical protein
MGAGAVGPTKSIKKIKNRQIFVAGFEPPFNHFHLKY